MLNVTRKIAVRRVLACCLLLFIVVNVVAMFHAYKFTHFASGEAEKTASANGLSRLSKLKVVLTGVDNPRPRNDALPSQSYETVSLKSKNDTI